jgi:hypothetical protein
MSQPISAFAQIPIAMIADAAGRAWEKGRGLGGDPRDPRQPARLLGRPPRLPRQLENQERPHLMDSRS